MKKFFIIVFSVLVLILSGLYLFQEKLIFRSIKLEKDYTFIFDLDFEEHFINTGDGELLNVLWFKPQGESKGLVFYFHGNAGNLQRWGNYASDLVGLGYDVVMMDYRGYGKSTGSPSEESFYADAETIYKWARAKSVSSRIVIYGRSLGTPVATHLASGVQPELLILETPFDELRGALPPWVQTFEKVLPLRYEFPTWQYLPGVKGRKIIFHGTHDTVVPAASALRLKPLLQQGDEFILIPDGTHRNLRTFEVYRLKLTEVLQ